MREQLAKNLLILDSREAILALSPLLESLASRCGQPAAMHWLPYFLQKAVLGRRLPRLVLFLTPEKDHAESLRADNLQAAALFFEYQVFGLGTGIVATGDAVGFDSVLAPAGQRSRIAALALQALLDRGAALGLATFDEGSGASRAGEVLDSTQRSQKTRWALRQRRVARMLPLKATLDETLAQMGKATRFNLRYYRRRLQKQMNCTFHANALPLLEGVDLEALNANSLNPVEGAEFIRRISAASTLSGSFLCGLRAPDGRWLSLVGGWRQEQTTVLYWQMNTSGFEKHSIGTVMRSFFLEDEIARGCRNLLIYGGTPHSMGHAFLEDEVADLAMERPSFGASCLRQAARVLLAAGVFRSNFVLETLCSQELTWQTTERDAAIQRALREESGRKRANGRLPGHIGLSAGGSRIRNA